MVIRTNLCLRQRESIFSHKSLQVVKKGMVIIMKQKNSYHMNIGGASILLVLAIFALTVFAILSLRASYHEVKMSEKTRASVQAYYEADCKAEEYYMQITEALANKEALDNQQLVQKLSGISNLQIDDTTNILTYLVSTDYNMALQVQLQLSKNSRKIEKVLSWRIISIEQGDYSSPSMEEVWNGILEE
jgi:S-adenosylhomocysteine hydrolase